MCRMAAYVGPELRLEQFLFEPEHNLIEQSWRPREMSVGHLNADGYGFSWYTDDTPSRFVSPFPIWGDVNLPSLGRSLRSRVWLGAVRGATPGFPAHPANTQPFVARKLCFLHNGHIEHFSGAVRARLRAHLHPDAETGIEGTTDSEYLFALVRQAVHLEQKTPAAALAGLSETLSRCLGTHRALLNILLTDGQALIALRHATPGDTPPSLYYTQSDPRFPHATLVCSEPLTAGDHWRPIPPHAILVSTQNRAVEIQPL